MTDDELRAIRERWAGIGPGYSSEIDGRPSSIGVVAHHIKRVKQATSAAPTDIAALLAEVERLRAEQSRDFDDIVQRVTDRMVAFALSSALTMPEPVVMPDALRAFESPYMIDADLPQ